MVWNYTFFFFLNHLPKTFQNPQIFNQHHKTEIKIANLVSRNICGPLILKTNNNWLVVVAGVAKQNLLYIKQIVGVQTVSVSVLSALSHSFTSVCLPRSLLSFTLLILERGFLVRRIPACTCQVTHDHGRTRLPVMTFTAISASMQVSVSPLPEIVRQILS